MIKLLRPDLLTWGVCIAGIGYAQSTATFNSAHAGNATADPGTFAKYTKRGATDSGPGSGSVAAYGFDTTETAVDLYSRYDGARHVGPGSARGNHRGIDGLHFIPLHTNSLATPEFKMLTFGFGNGQANESAVFYGSNALGQVGTLLYSDTNTTGSAPYTGPPIVADPAANLRRHAATALNGTGKIPDANVVVDNGTANFQHSAIPARNGNGSTGSGTSGNGKPSNGTSGNGTTSDTSFVLENGANADSKLTFGGNSGFAAVTPEGPSAAMLMFGLIPVGVIVLRGRRASRA